MSGETYTLKCRVCEREFTVTGARRKGTKYCDDCRPLVDRMHKRESDKRRRRAQEKKRRSLAVSKSEHQKPETRNPKKLTRGGIRQAMVCAGLQGVRTLDGIMAARTKPPHMSDVRWRIELRRRANKDYYNYCPAVVR